MTPGATAPDSEANVADRPDRLASIMGCAFGAGALLRHLGLGYTNSDTFQYLLPWYGYARDHGLASLGVAFTNYTPFFTYLLVGAATLDGLMPPLALIKTISFAFELGCAVLAFRIVRELDPDRRHAALAFSSVWLLPSVLHNGALWGQADAIWTFFLLWALLAILRGRPVLAMLAFSTAFAVKAQAVFLGPVLLGLALRGRMPWTSFALLPLVYLALAVPVLAAGRPLGDVLTVYLDQAQAFRLLSTSAANLYIFAPESWYAAGVWTAMAVAAACGLAMAVAIGRAERLSGETLVFASAVCLLLMPFVLPKMHERYFYGFELLIVVVACSRPAFWRVAILAQVTSALAYLPYDGRDHPFVPGAAMTNLVLLAVVVGGLHRILRARAPDAHPTLDADRLSRAVTAVWAALLAQYAGSRWLGSGGDVARIFPTRATDLAGLMVYLAMAGALAVALMRTRPAPARLGSA